MGETPVEKDPSAGSLLCGFVEVMNSSLPSVPRSTPEAQTLAEAATFSTAGISLQEGSRRKPSSESFLELCPEEPPTCTWGMGLGRKPQL